MNQKNWKKEETIFYFLHHLYLHISLQGWASASGAAKYQPTKMLPVNKMLLLKINANRLCYVW